MPSPIERERLQPSLFDRLEDNLGPTLGRLSEVDEILVGILAPSQLESLRQLLDEHNVASGKPSARNLAPFADLDDEVRALVQESITLAHQRLAELQRAWFMSHDRLRETCLRDLQCLFNETNLESGMPLASMADVPAVASSVLNYGVPAIAGGNFSPEQLRQLGRGIERALARFEPRIRHARVSLDLQPGGNGEDGIASVGYVIEGELWGYPVSERLRVRTMLDLYLGHISLPHGSRGAPA